MNTNVAILYDNFECYRVTYYNKLYYKENNNQVDDFYLIFSKYGNSTRCKGLPDILLNGFFEVFAEENISLLNDKIKMQLEKMILGEYGIKNRVILVQSKLVEILPIPIGIEETLNFYHTLFVSLGFNENDGHNILLEKLLTSQTKLEPFCVRNLWGTTACIDKAIENHGDVKKLCEHNLGVICDVMERDVMEQNRLNDHTFVLLSSNAYEDFHNILIQNVKALYINSLYEIYRLPHSKYSMVGFLGCFNVAQLLYESQLS